MISGPLSLRLVGAFLGKGEAAMAALIADETEGFPAVTINSERKPMTKVFFNPLLAWVNKGAAVPMTAEQLDDELERCRGEIERRDARKRASRAEAVGEQAA